MVSFSIITPVYIHSPQRKLGLLRAIHSVVGQTYPYEFIEHIVVDDGSPVVFPEIEELNKLYPYIKYQKNTDHLERLYAYHDAFALATGDWFVFLDSDDQLNPYALETYNKVIEQNPDYKMFNFGSVHMHKDGRIAMRGPFQLPKKEVGHEMFGKGQIVNGTFIFHKSVFEDLGGFPSGTITPENQDELEKIYGRRGDLAMTSPWDFSCLVQLQFPELRPYCMVDKYNEPGKIIQELGNPWGQDFMIFYKYTRKYHSLPLDLYLYWVFSK